MVAEGSGAVEHALEVALLPARNAPGEEHGALQGRVVQDGLDVQRPAVGREPVGDVVAIIAGQIPGSSLAGPAQSPPDIGVTGSNPAGVDRVVVTQSSGRTMSS